jgi:uncharacterized repeat protein (TIGR01451 family)
MRFSHHLSVNRPSPARTVTALLLVVSLLSPAFGLSGEAASADLGGGRQAPLATGSTLYVCNSGCATYDYPTITGAVNHASSGDEIRVAQGTYNETVQVEDKSLTILGGYATNWSVRNPDTYLTTIKAQSGKSAVRLVSSNGSHAGTLDGFNIRGGNSSGAGGGIFVRGYQATISNNWIHDNQAAMGGGINVQAATGVTIQGNVIEENTAIQDGGGVRVSGATVSILGNDILDNTATLNGGGINVIGGTVTIDDNKINSNVSQEKGGGGIMLRSDAYATITNNRIKKNRSVVGGGGMRIEDSAGVVLGNDIMNNTCSNTGGGLAVVRSQVDVEDNDFYYNVAGGGGGLQFSIGSTGLITNNRLVENKAGTTPGGGGIHFWQCSPQFISNTVTGNRAGNAGGGVNIEDSSPLVKDNVITGNHAGDHGGGVSMSVGAAPTLRGNTIADNTCSDRGGGIFSYSSAPKIVRNEIVDNEAPTAAGIHLTGSVGFEVSNNIIARNKATVEGGGIHLTSNSRGDIINNTIVNNNLGAGGEAINLRNSARPRIANNILVGQTYGVRVREDAAPTVEYNDVWNSNIADYDGVGGNPGHLSCNPQFVNVAAGDYHLTAGSCVIDSGSQEDAPTIDFDGDGRPLDGDGDGNALWDRGADEYQNPVWVTKEVDELILDAGEWLSYSILYRNNSASTATGVTISDPLSDYLVNSSYSSTGPTLSLQGGTRYVWTVPGGLAPGAEGTITIDAQVDPALSTPQGITNVVTFEMDCCGPFEAEVMGVAAGLRTFVPLVSLKRQ